MTCKVVAIEHVTLDGVYQGPARADEDMRNGFQRGGWAEAGNDPQMQKTISPYMEGGWSLLVGSTTYASLYEGWHVRQPEAPMAQALAHVPKFVASRNPDLLLPWENSVLLKGDAVDSVARLKQEYDKTLVIFGSGVLLGSLLRESLIDELLLMVHPILLGEGARLFEKASFAKLTLTKESTTDTGVVISNYRLCAQ